MQMTIFYVSFSPKLECITLNIANHFSMPIWKLGVLLTQTTVHNSKCCKPFFSYPLSKGSLTHSNSSVLLKFLQMTLRIPISKEIVLPTQSLVHNSKCYKLLFSYPLSMRESYASELQCIT